jgi:hypothetical protein
MGASRSPAVTSGPTQDVRYRHGGARVVGRMGRLIYFLRLHVSQAREILLRTARPSPTGLSASKLVAMRTRAHGKRRTVSVLDPDGGLAASRGKRGNNNVQ